MCLQLLKSLLAILKTTSKLELTHPEEPPDYSRTEGDVSPRLLVGEFLHLWDVPREDWDYWYGFNVVCPSPYGDAANCDFENNILYIRPEYANPGVIAHEFAHESYSLLTDEAKVGFSAIYDTLKGTDPLIKFLYSQNAYGLKNDMEGHAELYRYLTYEMPKALHKFYPRLLV